MRAGQGGWLLVLGVLVVVAGPPVATAAPPATFETLGREFTSSIKKLVLRRCVTCHSMKKKKGELDLQRFDSLAAVRRDPKVWVKSIEMLDDGEMPPKGAPQLTPAEKKSLRGWARRYLDAEAYARAGDPGRVVLRRLSNVEYTQTIRDLTGIALNPAREFPVDGAAGEGFTNTGEALVMSPSLLNKYLDAAKLVARHAVLLPEGFRFDPGVTRRDWTDALMSRIQRRYRQHVGSDGRVNLAAYLAATVRHRKAFGADPAAIDRVAADEKLSAPYLRRIWEQLSRPGDSSLLAELSAAWRTATPADVPALLNRVKAWEPLLWQTGTVGHFKPWQARITPLVSVRPLRVKLAAADKKGEITITLSAGTAGDGAAGDLVHWQLPRLVGGDRPTVLLRDVGAVAAGFARLHQLGVPATGRYLTAVAEVMATKGRVDVGRLATEKKLDRHLLSAWLVLTGVGDGETVRIPKHLAAGFLNRQGYDFIDGWGVQATPSLITNSSDNPVRVPGLMEPHAVAMHPSPTEFVAVGWRSPMSGTVRIEGLVKDVHANCGNGVDWRVELARGRTRRTLRDGTIELGKQQVIPAVGSIIVRPGDLISLKVGPRSGDHSCDLTRVNLVITELTGKKRAWNLETDVADTITAGNPHPDRHGHVDTWHFYQEPLKAAPGRSQVPEGSLLAGWLDATTPADREKLATRIEQLVAGPRPKKSEADIRLYDALTRIDGTLLSLVDPVAMAGDFRPKPGETLPGPDRRLFGAQPGLGSVAEADLVVQAPRVLQFRLPAVVAAGRELVVTGRLHPAGKGRGSVQLEAGAEGFPVERLKPGVPVVVAEKSPGAQRFRRAVGDFQDLFPAAMCYYRIVPVDEVITLVLFHREDESLRRLMCDDKQRRELEADWNELRFVSQDALKIHGTFDLFQGFASQVGKVETFEPLREPIRKRAEAFGKRLVKSEPIQVERLLEFTERAWRRPLSKGRQEELRALYRRFRGQGLDHKTAWRLLLTRILVSAHFLYKVEQPADGKLAQPVNDWELASRLSYFLWSTLPDGPLRRSAAKGELQDPAVLQRHAMRMLSDSRLRSLATEFAAQWIGIRGFDQHDEKNEKLFPEFATLRGAMYEESVKFFEHLFRNDRSLLEVLDADYTFVNATLAHHYGFDQQKPASGATSGWWRVDGLKRRGRGGILGMASLLSKQSGASRTSPVLRGNWVVETFLGEKLPKPPAKVPDLPESETDTNGLTIRQLVEKHRQVASCAVCHERIDPFGFALESFDAIGRFRERDLAGRPVDTRVTLKDGTRFEGLGGLRTYLLKKRRDEFVGQFCRKLLGFALGRAVELSDEPLLKRMQQDLRQKQFRVSAAMKAIVTSRQFRYHRGLLATK
ncbi:MAG: hypothetical protein CMJ65_08650 [Planctomycetaceae bacterium]|jgi:mono/diheme cytochrome c family protein|nr:hypothetical protein [Planctomycetaceae bacterium]MDP7277131.1 DUF1592 domain-containing protein [Planctomycetaceae bacterium]